MDAAPPARPSRSSTPFPPAGCASGGAAPRRCGRRSRDLDGGAAPQRRGPRGAADLRPGAPRPGRRRRGRALVHGPLRPGLAAHLLDGAAVGRRASLSGPCRRWPAARARVVDPATEEEPGRILHEVRFGPAASLALGGRSAYYGTADATPLFVMLLGELRRWGRPDADGRRTCCRTPTVRWSGSSSYGDRDGDGFVEYQRTTERGLVNQGWKDSWDGDHLRRRAASPSRPSRWPRCRATSTRPTWPAPHFAREAGDEAPRQRLGRARPTS